MKARWDLVKDELERRTQYEQAYDAVLVAGASVAVHGIDQGPFETYCSCRAWDAQITPGHVILKAAEKLAEVRKTRPLAYLAQYRGVTKFGVEHLWIGVEWPDITEADRLTLEYDNCSHPCPPWCGCVGNCPGSCPPGYPCRDCCPPGTICP
jgi:hypothetical protein